MASAALVALVATNASADAIYGCWSNGAERLQVRRDGIVTPGGASPEAYVDRHNTAYVAPNGERDAGLRLEFSQLNDLEVRRTTRNAEGGAPVGAVEIWRPCGQEHSS
ncbi:MAG: hypothetical protein KTR21_03905 [Rhodobacteraceae bacterium]|nr:hypothetical protein [Paracoccaceae bacterium]